MSKMTKIVENLTDEKAIFNYIANDILGEVKPLYLRNRIIDKIFDLLYRMQEESERLTEKAERVTICEKDYLEWATGFLKTRFDIKDWFTNPEHQRTPCTYEFFASTLWAKIESAMKWLIELEERNDNRKRENAELTEECSNKQYEIERLEEEKEFLQEQANILAGAAKRYSEEKAQAVKDTVAKIIVELNRTKNIVRENYGTSEQVGVDIAINRVEEFYKELTEGKA